MDADQHADVLEIATADDGGLPLTDERRAYLLPRLRVLLKDFAKLDALVQPELEPAATVRPRQDGDDAGR